MPLSATEAQRRLAEVRVSEVQREEVVQRYRKTLGLADGSDFGSDYSEKIGNVLGSLTFLTRASTIKAIAGPLRSVFDQAVKASETMPYQVGLQRLPFRTKSLQGIRHRNLARIATASNHAIRHFDQPIEWFAEWIGYLGDRYYLPDLDVLLAAAIDGGNGRVLDILMQSCQGTHPIGVVSAIGIRALLRCGRPEAWSLVAKLLLEARGAEGLRQPIIECADELNPLTFQKLVRLVVEHNLLRFSSVMRAFLVWFPELIEEGKSSTGEQAMMRMLEFMGDRTLPPQPTYEDVYLRLWVDAYFEVADAIDRGRRLMDSPVLEVRRAVATVGKRFGVSSVQPLIERVLDDPDLSVASHGVMFVSGLSKNSQRAVFHDRILNLARKWPAKPEKLPSRNSLWDLAFSGSQPHHLPYYFEHKSELSADGRWHLARSLHLVSDSVLRKDMALAFTADGSAGVRSAAFASLAEAKLTEKDAIQVESLLTRKAADLRTAALAALLRQKEAEALESARRLVGANNSKQVLAGQELATALIKKGVSAAKGLVSGPEMAPPRDEDAGTLFGLMDLKGLTWGERPEPVADLQLFTHGAMRLITALDDYIHSRRDDVTTQARYPHEQKSIGDLTSSDVRPYRHFGSPEMCPFVEEVRQWLVDFGEWDLAGSADFFRAQLIAAQAPSNSNQISADGYRRLSGKFDRIPVHLSAIKGLLATFVSSATPPPKLMLEFLQNEIAITADDRYSVVGGSANEESWRTKPNLVLILDLLTDTASRTPASFQPDDWRNLWRLCKFVDEPAGSQGRAQVEQMHRDRREELAKEGNWFIRDVIGRHRQRIPYRKPLSAILIDRCYTAGVINESDVLDQARWNFREITSRAHQYSPQLRATLQKLVDAVVRVETRRGDLAGPASEYASEVSGMIHLPQVLQILETETSLSRTPRWFGSCSLSRAQSFTRLLSYSAPTRDETVQLCADAFRSLQVKPDRLVELAMLSPHWAAPIADALGWEGLEDAVWWLHAHTKDDSYGLSKEIKEIWTGAISERTPIPADRLELGYCDAPWFFRFRHHITDDRWKLLEKCAKFACSGSGHVRAQLFAKALGSELSVDSLLANIQTKRNPNHVRAVGLCPLGENRDAEVRRRYLALQEFKAGSRQFGAMKRETEKLAVEVAMDNLARTAGYPDALRLSWRLEANEVADLRGEGLTVTDGDLSTRLYFDDLGQPQVEAIKAGRSLKEVPAAARKVPSVKSILERRNQLKKQLVRMRFSLEQAMQRGDNFTPGELEKLMEHPGLRPLLQNLVFVGESGVVDFPNESGRVGSESGILRIAHPHDLLILGVWPELQRRVFLEERAQPFKQVFREHYLLTDPEKPQREITRYGGHQVRSGRALGILGKRGWILRHEEGLSKTDHGIGVTAWLNADYVGFSPADIEGFTIGSVIFTRSGSYEPIALTDVPPMLFSETLRDIDLIVSVASSVGVDPEASESTVEMRQSIVEQTAQLLRLENISFIPRHVVVRGQLAEYTVHLGSGTVRQRAKGELVIVAVRQPQRGRIFLPFVDDDPRTAEIVSKVILLARDKQINDPTIMRQIIGGS